MSGFEDDDFADDKFESKDDDKDDKDDGDDGEESSDRVEKGSDDSSEDEAPRSLGRKKKSLGGDDDEDEGGDEDYSEFEEKKEKTKSGPVYPYTKFVKFTGKISPLKKDEKGAIIQIKIENIDDKKVYAIEMNENGKKLIRSCFQELFITGELLHKSEKENILIIKSFL